jgi:hypothetical protein
MFGEGAACISEEFDRGKNIVQHDGLAMVAGLSVSATKSRFNRARRALRQSLAG